MIKSQLRLVLSAVLAAGTFGLAACGDETTTAPPTGTPTAPLPPQQPEEMEHVPPPENADPGEAVPDAGADRPVVEQEGPGAPGTREGPTVR